jgi:hypothetical protein
VVLFTLSALPARTGYATPDLCQSLEWAIRTEKSSYYPGEPVALVADVTNLSEGVFEISLPFLGFMAAEAEIRDDNGERIPEKEPRRNPMVWGIWPSDMKTVAAGQTTSFVFILNAFSSTLLEPGHYQVHFKLRPDLKWFSPDNNAAVVETATDHLPSLQTQLTIIPMEEARLIAILESICKTPTRESGESESSWQQQKRWSRWMLCFAEGSSSIQYRLRLVEDLSNDRALAAKNEHLRIATLESLAASTEPGAVLGIIDLYDRGRLKDLEPVARELIWRIHEQGNSDLTSATQAFVAGHPRDTVPLLHIFSLRGYSLFGQ